MEFFRRLAEQRIDDAAQNGEFDNLPNAGTKIDYQVYLKVPASVRLIYKLLKEANCLPPEIELHKEIKDLEERIARAKLTEEQKLRLQKILKFRQIEADLKKSRR